MCLLIVVHVQVYDEHEHSSQAVCASKPTTSGEAQDQRCSSLEKPSFSYSSVLHPSRDASIAFEDLPGFTRSEYHNDHALITPGSRVWTTLYGWKNGETAHLISKASGAQLSMYLAKLKEGGSAPMPAKGIERFLFVLEGSVTVERDNEDALYLHENAFAYMPANFSHRITSTKGGGFLVYEHVYERAIGYDEPTEEDDLPQFLHGIVDDQPVLPAPGEVFVLRKLLPQTHTYDFNVHIMDFKPGEHLFVKEVHYNEHGLVLLQGKGIYRLADNWYPVQSGDAIWMAPYVVQWYAALGYDNSRYIIYKDTRPPK